MCGIMASNHILKQKKKNFSMLCFTYREATICFPLKPFDLIYFGLIPLIIMCAVNLQQNDLYQLKVVDNLDCN